MRERATFPSIAAAIALGALLCACQRRTPQPTPPAQSTAPLPASASSSSTGPVTAEPSSLPSADRARDLQRKYWSPSPDEKGRLQARGMATLSWTEKLRLLHLTCLDELSTEASRRILDSEDPDPTDMPAGPNRDLVKALVTNLRSAASPFRPRHASIWTGKAGESEQREPNVQGLFENASLTHLGSLEVVRLDDQRQPVEIAFVPLDDLRGVILASPAIFRLAKLLFDDGRPDEIVLLPLIYGVSWSTANPANHDGSLTTFVSSLQLPGKDQVAYIGIGHQDFLVHGAGEHMIGLGNIGEIMIALSVDDPRFEQKCRARGLDPAAVRADLAKKR
jgi:hypothetical protein